MNRLQRFAARFLFPRLPKLIESSQQAVRESQMRLEMANDSLAVQREEAQRVTAELMAAEAMRGTGPFMGAARLAQVREAAITKLKERFWELELALDDRGWQRMESMAQYEFSRYGIQQIILISRLYLIKNPLIRRGVKLTGYYVFGRGIEIRSSNEAANNVIQRHLEANARELGHSGLVEKEESRHTDGNLFFAAFPKESTGEIVWRMIDPIEVVQIVTDPDDSSVEQYIRRQWTEVSLDLSGVTNNVPRDEWYPSLDLFESGKQPLSVIGGQPVQKYPVFHVKAGGLPKWHFGCPLVYSALDWAKAYNQYMSDFCSVKRAHARFAWKVETQGGTAAIQAYSKALTSTLGDGGTQIERNPTATTGASFISGPADKMEPMDTKGKTSDPDEARPVGQMVAAALDLPETMLFGRADVGNLATAQTLDRPTELKFQYIQQIWREILTRMLRFVLNGSKTAPNGVLKESLKDKPLIIMTPMAKMINGKLVEVWEVNGKTFQTLKEAQKANPEAIDITIKFPSVLEHSLKDMVSAVVEAMTLGSKMGQINGIDAKTGVSMLLSELGYEDVDGLLDKMFPDATYEPDRTLEPVEPEPTPMAQLAKAAEALR